MKILVTAKRVPDPDGRLVLESGGQGIASVGVTFVLNPFDAIALEEALRIRERGSQSVGRGEYLRPASLRGKQEPCVLTAYRQPAHRVRRWKVIRQQLRFGV